MRKLQSQGVHHITIVGADRQTSIDLESHLYFSHAAVLSDAHRIRVERGDHTIAPAHLADAIETLVTRRAEWLTTH